MNKRQLVDAIYSAERFLSKAKFLLDESETNNRPTVDSPLISDERRREKYSSWSSGAKNAAVKRASMDLTRTLAQMRKYEL